MLSLDWRSRLVSRRLLVKHFANFRHQRSGREGLLQKERTRLAYLMMREGLAGITGHEENDHTRARAEQLIEQDSAAHMGHDDVGEDQRDVACMCGAQGEGFRAVARFQYLIALRAEDSAGKLPNRIVVFHQQYGFTDAGTGSGCRHFDALGRWAGRESAFAGAVGELQFHSRSILHSERRQRKVHVGG